jgi:hypothetical protein
MLVELLRPATPELARRWVAALLLVPESERAAVVESIESRIVDTYARAGGPGGGPDGPARGAEAPATDEQEMVVVYPPAQRDGHVEQVERVYAVRPGKAAAAGGAEPAGKNAGRRRNASG